MDMEKFDWKNHLLECMESTDYCSLATVDEKRGVWVNPVYFAWDQKFNLYFISLMKSRHMQNLAKDSSVSMAIYKTEQKGGVIGIQLEGTAKILTENDKQEKEHAFNTYYGRTGSLEQNETFKHNPEWIFVKITSGQMYYFNSKVFGEERQTVPMGRVK